MVNDHEPLIVNAIGHLAGAIVFGIFLVLALRGATGRRSRENWLSVASAGLAWAWNAVSFASLVLPSGTARWALEAVSFSSLSLLPAVLLHLSLNGRFRVIAASGYVLSAVAKIHYSFGRLGKRPATAAVPIIVCHRCVEMLEAVGHGAVANRAGRTA